MLHHIYGCIILVCIFVAIIYQIKENFTTNDPFIDRIKSKVEAVFPELGSIPLFESNSTSYTLNKNRIFLCIKDKNGNYYSDDIIIFVLLHEIAHLKCTDIGHTKQFQIIFQQLLERATDAGIYKETTIPADYCVV